MYSQEWGHEEKAWLVLHGHVNIVLLCLFSSVQISRSAVSNSFRPHELQHARPPCPSPTPGIHPNSCPSSLWCHPAMSSSIVPFSSHLRSFPTLGSFHMSQFFAWCGQIIGIPGWCKSSIPYAPWHTCASEHTCACAHTYTHTHLYSIVARALREGEL